MARARTAAIFADLAVPTLAALRRENPWVSTVSRWSYGSWRLDPENGSGQFHCLPIDAVDTPMREPARLLATLAMRGGPAHRPVSGNTLSSRWSEIAAVLNFLDGLIDGLDEVVPAHFAASLDIMRLRYAEERKAGPKTDGVPRAMLFAWKLLGELRGEMAAAGAPALGFDPFAEVPFAEILAGFEPDGPDRILPLPDAVVAFVYLEAERFVDEGGEDLVRLQRSVLTALERCADRPDARVLEIIRAARFDGGGDLARPWHSLPAGIADPDAALNHLNALLNRLVGACAIVSHHEMAFRPSEIVSPAAGRNEVKGLPSCIEAFDSEEGDLEVFLLHGTIVKHRERPEPHEWVMGAMPKGGNRRPPAVRALDILDRMHAPWRAMAESDRLLVNFNLVPCLRVMRASATPVRTRKLLHQMRLFVGTLDWAKVVAGGPRAAAIVADRGQGIGASELRKNFVNYFLRLDARLLGPVQGQLGHKSETCTEEDYLMNDATLLEPATELASVETARLMLAMSGAAGGLGLPAAGRLEADLPDVAAIREAAGPEQWIDRIAALVVERGLAVPRVPPLLADGPSPQVRGPALLERYRASRRAVLHGQRMGRAEDYEALDGRAARAKAALAAIGIDVPSDETIEREDAR